MILRLLPALRSMYMYHDAPRTRIQKCSPLSRSHTHCFHSLPRALDRNAASSRNARQGFRRNEGRAGGGQPREFEAQIGFHKSNVPDNFQFDRSHLDHFNRIGSANHSQVFILGLMYTTLSLHNPTLSRLGLRTELSKRQRTERSKRQKTPMRARRYRRLGP